jgi:hypothetical protein
MYFLRFAENDKFCLPIISGSVYCMLKPINVFIISCSSQPVVCSQGVLSAGPPDGDGGWGDGGDGWDGAYWVANAWDSWGDSPWGGGGKGKGKGWGRMVGPHCRHKPNKKLVIFSKPQKIHICDWIVCLTLDEYRPNACTPVLQSRAGWPPLPLPFFPLPLP